MTETIFIADGGRHGALLDYNARARKQREVTAYLYSGWEITGWGSAPVGSVFDSKDTAYLMTGFYVTRTSGEGIGFGAEALCARLSSGLHSAIPV